MDRIDTEGEEEGDASSRFQINGVRRMWEGTWQSEREYCSPTEDQGSGPRVYKHSLGWSALQQNSESLLAALPALKGHLFGIFLPPACPFVAINNTELTQRSARIGYTCDYSCPFHYFKDLMKYNGNT